MAQMGERERASVCLVRDGRCRTVVERTRDHVGDAQTRERRRRSPRSGVKSWHFWKVCAWHPFFLIHNLHLVWGWFAQATS